MAEDSADFSELCFFQRLEGLGMHVWGYIHGSPIHVNRTISDYLAYFEGYHYVWGKKNLILSITPPFLDACCDWC